MSQPWGPGAPGGRAPGGPPPGGGPAGPAYGQPAPGQPGYGQPGYGQPGYGQPGYGHLGSGPAPGYGPYGAGPYAPGPRARKTGIAGVIVAIVGGLLMAVGFFAPWYSANGESLYLKDISKAYSADGAPGLPHAYFGWLLWVLFAVAVVAAFVACLPTGASIAMRIIAPIAGVLGAVLIVAALNTDRADGAPSIFEHAGPGLFAALLGFVVVGAGGIFGPSRA